MDVIGRFAPTDDFHPGADRRLGILVALLIACVAGCEARPGGSATNEAPYAARRAAFRTALKVHEPSPQPWNQEHLPTGVKSVKYPSAGRQLKAWLHVPPGDAERRPALVYLHGGFAFGGEDFEVCRPFTEAGFVVMCPMFRGENGNPGDFEMMMGEVDDAAAAIQWLAGHPSVDPERIYTFGHSSGGIISALLSLWENLPVQHSGSAGGLYGPDLFAAMQEIVPFELNDAEERQMRVLVGNIRWMKRGHYAIVGKGDAYMRVREARAEAKSFQAPLEIIEIPGDHHTSLAPAIREYLAITQEPE